ncbi:hypothetical protein SHKM778_44220 [Streptomyces sp. KM77-8]|uniref:Major facilitator superfamily (MFS) profile domain-containing protein n=1 Tax=Streptomyces haneummycinicus TaxID=3074435 RepID=A0AAT9HKZ1_9ACTN
MERPLRAARAATFIYFVLNGTLLGMWVVQIPAIEEQVGISHAALGGFLVLLGAGAFLGMQVGGRLSDRLGTRTVVPLAGILCSVTLILPGLAQQPWVLGAALLIFGFGNGTLDVSMNAHAVQVEKAYERPVMSAFHATFSIGGVLAALVGAAALGIGWGPAATLTAVAGPASSSHSCPPVSSCRPPPPSPLRMPRAGPGPRSALFPPGSGSSPSWLC